MMYSKYNVSEADVKYPAMIIKSSSMLKALMIKSIQATAPERS